MSSGSYLALRAASLVEAAIIDEMVSRSMAAWREGEAALLSRLRSEEAIEAARKAGLAKAAQRRAAAELAARGTRPPHPPIHPSWPAPLAGVPLGQPLSSACRRIARPVTLHRQRRN